MAPVYFGCYLRGALAPPIESVFLHHPLYKVILLLKLSYFKTVLSAWMTFNPRQWHYLIQSDASLYIKPANSIYSCEVQHF